jgi:hypothetical protein
MSIFRVAGAHGVPDVLLIHAVPAGRAADPHPDTMARTA